MRKKELIAFGHWLRENRVAFGFSVSQIEWIADYLSTRNARFHRERWVGFVYGRNGPNGGRVR
jgi:hypothetical protein